MLPWWGWVLVWVGLLACSAAVVDRLCRQVWRKTKLLMAEVERASDLVSELEARADALSEVVPVPTAVTQDPYRLRAQYQAMREDAAAVRANRRAERLPAWARVH